MHKEFNDFKKTIYPMDKSCIWKKCDFIRLGENISSKLTLAPLWEGESGGMEAQAEDLHRMPALRCDS